MKAIFCGRDFNGKFIISSADDLYSNRRSTCVLDLGTRYRIVGIEVVGLGVFLLLILMLQLLESNWNHSVEAFDYVYAIIGITLILVGLEILSLNKLLPAQ